MADPIVYSQTVTVAPPNGVIPDGNLNGLASTMNVSGDLAAAMSAITSVTVTVDVSGAPAAWNGDYYAYLTDGANLVVLMANIGNPSGSTGGNGFDITFSSAPGNQSIQNAGVGNPLTGTYAPVGNLNTFDGPGSPVGNWTLFIADTQQFYVGQLDNWTLTVTGVPDNGSTFAMLGFGAGLLGLCALRRQPRPALAVSRKS